MNWTRSDTIALAKNSCTSCHGLGLRFVRKEMQPCNCVLRAIFRACFAKFRYVQRIDPHVSQVTWDRVVDGGSGKASRYSFGRKHEEYAADFYLISRRHLDEMEFRIFRLHFLLGCDWRACCARLALDRGKFFHAVYRIEQKLGRVFRELEPYPLFPLDDYFGGVRRHGTVPKPPAVEARRKLFGRPVVRCLAGAA
jgi:hypothetical protein